TLVLQVRSGPPPHGDRTNLAGQPHTLTALHIPKLPIRDHSSNRGQRVRGLARGGHVRPQGLEHHMTGRARLIRERVLVHHPVIHNVDPFASDVPGSDHEPAPLPSSTRLKPRDSWELAFPGSCFIDSRLPALGAGRSHTISAG